MFPYGIARSLAIGTTGFISAYYVCSGKDRKFTVYAGCPVNPRSDKPSDVHFITVEEKAWTVIESKVSGDTSEERDFPSRTRSVKPSGVQFINVEEKTWTVRESKVSGDTSEEREFSKFSSRYDRSRRTAIYVLEPLSKDNISEVGKKLPKRKGFKEDMTIHELFRSTKEDYKDHRVDRIGNLERLFDKGHLACVGNHPNDEKARGETSILSIIVPQHHACNAGVWNELENRVRKLLRRKEYVTVCSGPLYIPREIDFDKYDEAKKEIIGEFLEKKDLSGKCKIMIHEMMGSIAVPTHFFKVIIFKNKDTDPISEGYIVKNAPVSKPTKLADFKVPIEEIEKLSGYLFTSGYIKKKAEDMKRNLQNNSSIKSFASEFTTTTSLEII